jgi:hypothetical protein
MRLEVEQPIFESPRDTLIAQFFVGRVAVLYPISLAPRFSEVHGRNCRPNRLAVYWFAH